MKEINNGAGQCVIEEKLVVKIYGRTHTCRAGIVSSCFIRCLHLEERIWIHEKEEAGNCKHEEHPGVGRSRHQWAWCTGESVGRSAHTEEKGSGWQGTNTGLRNLDFV